MHPATKQRLLITIGILGIVGAFAPTLYWAGIRANACIYNHSWSPVPFPLSSILVPVDGKRDYTIDLSFSDMQAIKGNYTIYVDDDLVFTQVLDVTRDYDESSVDVTQYHYFTPDHSGTLNITLSITSGASCTMRIIKDWTSSSDVWLAIGGGIGVGFVIYMVFVVGSALQARPRQNEPAPPAVARSSPGETGTNEK